MSRSATAALSERGYNCHRENGVLPTPSKHATNCPVNRRSEAPLTRSNALRFGASSDRPLYRQVVDRLRREIAGRAPGERIDSEPQLTKRFGVSRFTVARAIEILVEEGLVNRRQGLGSFVAAPTLKRAPAYLSSFSEAIAAAGQSSSHRLLAFGPTSWRETLPYDEDEALIALDRLRLVDGVPTAIHRSVISAAVAERAGLTAEAAARPNFSLYRLFEDAGLLAARGVEQLRARRATTDESELLDLHEDEDRVVMSVRRHTFAADGTILDVVEAVYDARRYVYEADTARSGLGLTQPLR
jgi:GntR family transcriptional regulator